VHAVVLMSGGCAAYARREKWVAKTKKGFSNSRRGVRQDVEARPRSPGPDVYFF
jgi:hypothetical protein